MMPASHPVPPHPCPHCGTLLIVEKMLLRPSLPHQRKSPERPEWHCDMCGRNSLLIILMTSSKNGLPVDSLGWEIRREAMCVLSTVKILKDCKMGSALGTSLGC